VPGSLNKLGIGLLPFLPTALALLENLPDFVIVTVGGG
jgi:hypothetical protein